MHCVWVIGHPRKMLGKKYVSLEMYIQKYTFLHCLAVILFVHKMFLVSLNVPLLPINICLVLQTSNSTELWY